LRFQFLCLLKPIQSLAKLDVDKADDRCVNEKQGYPEEQRREHASTYEHNASDEIFNKRSQEFAHLHPPHESIAANENNAKAQPAKANFGTKINTRRSVTMT